MFAAALVAVALAGAVPPNPTRWVEDHAGLISEPARAALDLRLEGYERATGHQVIVWIGDTVGAGALDDWAVRTFAAWHVGRKGEDDGVAVFVLASDHTIAIEVGYGLEANVPDAIAARIIAEVMAPKLRAGDADAAITAGADAILAAIEGAPWTGASAPPTGAVDTPYLVFGVMMAIGFVILAVFRPRLALFLLLSSLGRGRRGGGGGGFGGGGGRSGGGGARGGW